MDTPKYDQTIAVSGGKEGCTPFIEFIFRVIAETWTTQKETFPLGQVFNTQSVNISAPATCYILSVAMVGFGVAVVGVAGWLEDRFFSLFLRLVMATIVIENPHPEKVLQHAVFSCGYRRTIDGQS